MGCRLESVGFRLLATSGQFRFDGQVVIDGLDQVLPGPKIALGRLNRSVAEQKLDLFQVAARHPAQLSAGPPQIVRCQTRMAEPGAVGADHVPDGVLAEAPVEHSSRLVQGPEHGTLGNTRGFPPLIKEHLDPGRNRNRPEPISLPRQVGQHPARVAQLDLFDIERDELGPAESAADQQREQRPVAQAEDRVPVRGVEKGGRLFRGQPVPCPVAQSWRAADAADARSELRVEQSVVGRFNRQLPEGAQVDIHRGGGEALRFEVGAVALDRRLGETGRPARLVPGEEARQRPAVAAAGVR